MVGFSGILKSEFQSKFCFIVSEDWPASSTLHYLRTLVQNHAEENKNCVHLLTFVHEVLVKIGGVNHYDPVRENYPDINSLFLDLKSRTSSSKRNIFILDDLSLFSGYFGRDTKNIQRFFKQLSKVFAQTFIFCVTDTISREQISVVSNLAQHLAVLKNPESNSQECLCNLLSIKPSGKTVLDQTFFHIKDGTITDSSKVVQKSVTSENSDDVIRSLTTFKLTIEDSERESKNQLYLPYLDAQRTTVPNPVEDFYDDDDEDEDD